MRRGDSDRCHVVRVTFMIQNWRVRIQWKHVLMTGTEAVGHDCMYCVRRKRSCGFVAWPEKRWWGTECHGNVIMIGKVGDAW